MGFTKNLTIYGAFFHLDSVSKMLFEEEEVTIGGIAGGGGILVLVACGFAIYLFKRHRDKYTPYIKGNNQCDGAISTDEGKDSPVLFRSLGNVKIQCSLDLVTTLRVRVKVAK